MASFASVAPSLAHTPGPVALPSDVRLMNAAAALLALFAAIALAASALVWVARQPMFRLQGITLQGDLQRHNVSTLRAHVMHRLGGDFFTVDLQAARRAFESAPWVRRALVRRVWPNRLVVQIEEHRPAALWAVADGEDRLVNTYGEVFEVNLGDVEDESLPVLAGPDGSALRLLGLHARLAPLFERLDLRLAKLALSGRGSWRAELDGGAVVEMGRGTDDDVVARAERFARTVSQVTGRYQRALEYADLRHTGGYAVRLQGMTTAVAASQPDAPASRSN